MEPAPVQLSGPSLGLPSHLRDKIVSYLPLWQLQMWDQAQQNSNCRPDLPASAQAYSQLFSASHVAQILQLRYDLSSDQLAAWYHWTLKPCKQLDIPLLTPMQAFSRIAYYFNEIGFDTLFQFDFDYDDDHSLLLFIAQTQAANGGTMELALFCNLLKECQLFHLLHIYSAMMQPKVILQLYSRCRDKIVPATMDLILSSYWPTLEQVQLVDPQSLPQYQKGLTGSTTVKLANSHRAYDYFIGIMRRKAQIPQLDIGTNLGQQFITTDMLQLTEAEASLLRPHVSQLYSNCLCNLDFFSLMQLKFVFGSEQFSMPNGCFPDFELRIITRQKIATVPLLRTWVLDNLTTSSWRQGYLLILAVIMGETIEMPKLNKFSAFKVERDCFSNFMRILQQLIHTMAGPNFCAKFDTGEMWSDKLYRPDLLVRSNRGLSNLINFWRIGSAIELTRYNSIDVSLKYRDQSGLQHQSGEQAIFDLIEDIKLRRQSAANSKLRRITAKQLSFHRTILSLQVADVSVRAKLSSFTQFHIWRVLYHDLWLRELRRLAQKHDALADKQLDVEVMLRDLKKQPNMEIKSIEAVLPQIIELQQKLLATLNSASFYLEPEQDERTKRCLATYLLMKFSKTAFRVIGGIWNFRVEMEVDSESGTEDDVADDSTEDGDAEDDGTEDDDAEDDGTEDNGSIIIVRTRTTTE